MNQGHGSRNRAAGVCASVVPSLMRLAAITYDNAARTQVGVANCRSTRVKELNLQSALYVFDGTAARCFVVQLLHHNELL